MGIGHWVKANVLFQAMMKYEPYIVFIESVILITIGTNFNHSALLDFIIFFFFSKNLLFLILKLSFSRIVGV